jgi:hypothetical protein
MRYRFGSEAFFEGADVAFATGFVDVSVGVLGLGF